MDDFSQPQMDHRWAPAKRSPIKKAPGRHLVFEILSQSHELPSEFFPLRKDRIQEFLRKHLILNETAQ
jgi:hypothetical protein